MPETPVAQATNAARVRIPTRLTDLLGIDLPIICGPMFLVSDVDLAVACSQAGILGSFPALNFRTPDALTTAIRAMHERTDRPFAVNLITNRSNVFLDKQLDICVAERVPIYITSLGDPRRVIERAKSYAARVICDVSSLDYASRVQAAGADAVNAVVSGAGGHVGHLTGFVLVRDLRRHLSIPVVLAGGVADGHGVAAALALGADGVQLGTRFIASEECAVTSDYKRAIVAARPDDVMLTARISGQPASVIRTPYTAKLREHAGPLMRLLMRNDSTRRLAKMVQGARAFVLFGNAAHRPTWKTVWAAGQAVGLVDRVESVARIVDALVAGYTEAVEALPAPELATEAVVH